MKKYTPDSTTLSLFDDSDFQPKDIKQCACCRQKKTHADFVKDRGRPDGLFSYCKKCVAARTAEFRNTDRGKEYTKEFFASDIGKESVAKHKRTEKYRDAVKRSIHSEKRRQYEQSERGMEVSRRAKKKYARLHPEASLICGRRRRQREMNSEGEFTQSEFLQLCNNFGNKCLRCGATNIKLCADHVIPITHGGSSYIDNIQPLCRRCNSIKNVKTTDYRLIA